MHHIINNLWLGSQEDADALTRDNPEQITAILNVRGPDAFTPPGRDQSAEHPGKAYKWIPAPDIGSVSPKHVRWALSWLREQTEKGERILIHCKYGISRSPAILAAFMVDSGISPNLGEAKAAISAHRHVQPAAQIVPEVTPVVMVSALTGLPNRHAFDKAYASDKTSEDKATPFVAAVEIDLLKVFNDSYGKIAGDALLRRLAKLLTDVGLDAYHFEEKEQGGMQGRTPENERGNGFLCRAESTEDLAAKISQARKLFCEPFRLYANGRIQTIEGTDLSFAIGTNPETAQSALLNDAKKLTSRKESPEWLRKIIETGGGTGSW